MKFVNKILKDENPILLNILFATLISMLVFLIAFAPLVLYSLTLNPNLFAETEASVYGNFSEGYKMVQNILTWIEFFGIGTLIEYIRRKTSLKFALYSDTAIFFYRCGIVLCISFILLSFIGFFI